MAASYEVELYKALLNGLLLLLTWGLGQAVIAQWDVRKKRQEFDLQVAQRFQQLYGEFRDIDRMWKVLTYAGPDRMPLSSDKRLEARWTLLQRATTIEGGLEAILVKLATERRLEPDERETLGLFRQAFQKLREAIRNGTPLGLTYHDVRYGLFHELAARVAWMLDPARSRAAAKEPADARASLASILAVRSREWDDAIRAFAADADTMRRWEVKL